MSLAVYLRMKEMQQEIGPQIWIREDGQTKCVSREEWDERFPDREPAVIENEFPSHEVYSANITHNLGKMASEAGVYKALWRPDENDMTVADDLVGPLRDGLAKLQTDPEHYKQFNPENGWGDYEGLTSFIAGYLRACEMYPEAEVSVCR